MKVMNLKITLVVAVAITLPAFAGEDVPTDEGEESAESAPEEPAPNAVPVDSAVAPQSATTVAEAAPAAITVATIEAAPAPNPAGTAYDFIAEGAKRVNVREGDFSLQPPVGWEVYVNLPSLSLLMQVPHKQGEKYQRTIQVASFAGPRYMDEVTAKEYEDVIVRKFSVASSSIEDYRIRNHLPIEMSDGRQGLLFYTEFKIDDVALMQAHILVSSQTRHYLLTFSDVAEHFENEAASQFLTEAWDSMISVQLSSKTPARFESAAYIGIVAGAALLLGLLVFGFRQWRSGREYRDFANGKEGAVDEKSSVSSIHSGVSLIDSAVSQLKPKGKPSKKSKDQGDSSVQTMESRFTSDVEKFDTRDDKAV